MSADRVADDGRGVDRPTHDRPAHDGPDGGAEQSDLVDEAERESFPASDPASSWAGADRAPDEPSDGPDPDAPA